MVCILVTSCSGPVVPQFNPSAGTADDERSLGPTNLNRLQELTHFDFGDQVPVAGLAFSTDSSRLSAVHLSYKLRNLDLIHNTLASEFSITPVSMNTTVFDREARQVAVIRGDRLGFPAVNEPVERKGLRVWDTQTGLLKMDSYLLRFPGDGPEYLAFTPNSEWFIKYSVGGIKPWNIAEDSGSHSWSKVFMEFGAEYAHADDPHAFAIDLEGIYIAEGRGSGIIVMGKLDLSMPSYERVADLKTPGFKTLDANWDPNALGFSPDRHWLAVAAKKHFFVLDLQRGGQAHFTSELPITSAVSAVAFDPTGRLIAHGSKNGWQVWDVVNKKLLYEDTSVPVYVVAFSPDGRLIATGDAKGVVRIWTII